MPSSNSTPQSYLVCVCVISVVTIGMCKNDEQKALAGFCCFNAVTSLVTTGQRIAGVAAGAGTAPAIATKATRISESIVNDGCKQQQKCNHITKFKGIEAEGRIAQVYVLALIASAIATL